MTGINGIQIMGCDFSNTQLLPSNCPEGSEIEVADYGYGIVATDAGFTVQARCTGTTAPCTNYQNSSFFGLGHAISTRRVVTNRPFIVKQTDFSDCYLAINSRAVSGATILFNNFRFGNLPDACVNNGEQLGVFFENSIAGFTLQENNFYGMGEGNAAITVGIHCKNMGNFNNVIRRNNFNKLNYSNVAQGQNAAAPDGFQDRGLHYLCNDNDEILIADFSVAIDENTNANRIRRSQGEALPLNPEEVDYKATGNIFSYGLGLDILNQGEEIEYYFDQGSPIQVPLLTTGAVSNIQAPGNICSEDYCEPPCKTEEEIALEKERYYQSRSISETTMGQWTFLQSSGNLNQLEQSRRRASFHRQQMDTAAYTIVQHLHYDTLTFNEDSLNVWLDHLDVFEADLGKALQSQLLGNALMAGYYRSKAAARPALSNTQAQDLENMELLLDVMGNNSPYELEKGDMETLERIASRDLGWTPIIARNLLELAGYHFPPFYLLPEAVEKRNVGQYIANASGGVMLKAYPNPSTGTFQLIWQPEDQEVSDAILVVRDLSGKTVHTQLIQARQSQEINLKHCPSGVYYYQLSVAGQEPMIGKLIIQ
jgi:hypothetical protein